MFGGFFSPSDLNFSSLTNHVHLAQSKKGPIIRSVEKRRVHESPSSSEKHLVLRLNSLI